MKVKVRKRVLKDECQFLVHDIGNRFHKVKPTKQRQCFKTRFEMMPEKERKEFIEIGITGKMKQF